MFSWNCNESNSHRYDHDDCNNPTATASLDAYFHEPRIVKENLQDRSRGTKHNNRPKKDSKMSKIRLTTRSGRWRWNLHHGNPDIFPALFMSIMTNWRFFFHVATTLRDRLLLTHKNGWQRKASHRPNVTRAHHWLKTRRPKIGR